MQAIQMKRARSSWLSGLVWERGWFVEAGPQRCRSASQHACFLLILALCMAALLHRTVLIITDSHQSIAVTDQPLLPTQQMSEEAQTLSSARNITEEIEQVLAEQRTLIAAEMSDYVYDKINVSSLANLVPESGGRPLRSVVVTSWRSGSTFLGDVLNSHPGNWYHYEPLHEFDIVKIRGPPLAEAAITTLKELLRCNYTGLGLDHYQGWEKLNKSIFTYNQRLWTQCKAHPHLCWRSDFLSPMCKLFPAQSMKIVRLRLKLAEELLTDKDLGVKLLLLVRDPRGTMQSRRHRDWCPGNPDCMDPALLCADLTADYYAAVKIARKYPDSFRVIRYEDLSVEPYHNVQELLTFFNLNFHPAIRQFLDTHTKKNGGNAASTFRDSKSAPFHWRTDFEFGVVQYIQRVCTEAMQLWGYVPAYNESHMREFNPLASYHLNYSLSYVFDV